ncbi:MAG: hypothetical protein BJ554DRAFT_6781, partial [Olpidium bornovanus]
MLVCALSALSALCGGARARARDQLAPRGPFLSSPTVTTTPPVPGSPHPDRYAHRRTDPAPPERRAVQRAEENDQMEADDDEFGLVATSWQKWVEVESEEEDDEDFGGKVAPPVAVAEVLADGILNVVLDEDDARPPQEARPKVPRHFPAPRPHAFRDPPPEATCGGPKVEGILAGIQHTVRAEERLRSIFARLKTLADANRLSSDEQAFSADWIKTQAHLHAALLLQGHQRREVVNVYRRSILQNLKMDALATPETLRKLCYVTRDRSVIFFDEDERQEVLARRAKFEMSLATVQKTAQDIKKDSGAKRAGGGGRGGSVKKFRPRSLGGGDARAAGNPRGKQINQGQNEPATNDGGNDDSMASADVGISGQILSLGGAPAARTAATLGGCATGKQADYIRIMVPTSVGGSACGRTVCQILANMGTIRGTRQDAERHPGWVQPARAAEMSTRHRLAVDGGLD